LLLVNLEMTAWIFSKIIGAFGSIKSSDP